MARIRDDSIAAVREAARVDEVVGEVVQLRPAGGGSLKGLCPFHDERSPSFHVTPARGVWHCFGCGEGGDTIGFVQRVDGLTFPEAVERLAQRSGVALQYEEGGSAPRRQTGERQRLVEAHTAAAEFYAAQLEAPAGAPAREFLESRGFDRAAAARFGVGYAPDSYEALLRHLRSRGFTDDELTKGGLVKEGRRGPMDRFRHRVMWPIRDRVGVPVGFGGRRLRDDDPAKYLNSPQTPLYDKSKVLYGLDLARRAVAERDQVVVVEGYTDVMACHLAGVTTAVATCGTAFGAGHVAALRPVLRDSDAMRGEVVFTFDGDEAGRRAALKAFDTDQDFAAQTFVAVQPDGLDPCDLRLRDGDVGVRDLVARRVPLFEFAVRSQLAEVDLDTVEGREAALRRAVPVVAAIKDRSLREPYAQRLARWTGVEDPLDVVERVRRAAGEQAGRRAGRSRPEPDPRDPVRLVEREALKLAVQRPALAGPLLDDLEPEAWTYPWYAALRRVVARAGGCATQPGGPAWIASLREACVEEASGAQDPAAAAEQLERLLLALAAEPLMTTADEPDVTYARACVDRVREQQASRAVADLHARLQRMDPVADERRYRRLFGELMRWEGTRRRLRTDEAA